MTPMASRATRRTGGLATGRPHEGAEVLEQVAGVVGAGAGLRVVLDGKGRLVDQAEALDGVVVEVEVGQPDRAVGGRRLEPGGGRPSRPGGCLEAGGLGGDGGPGG